MTTVERRGPVVVLAVGMVACAVALMAIGRDFSFYADDMAFGLARREWTLDAFLEPHNGHLVLVSATVYKAYIGLVGFAESWPYRLTLIGFHLACVGLIYVLAARRVGAWLALVPAGLLLLPGDAHDDLLSSFQMAFVGSLAFGLGALVCLDRRTRRGDIAAAILVALSLASSGVGVPFALGIGVELFLTRPRRKRLWVVMAPLSLYALWVVGYREESGSMTKSIADVLDYMAHIAARASSGFGDMPVKAGGLLIVLVAGWLAFRFWRDRGLQPRAYVGIVGALGFWGLTALLRTENGDPYASRYVYVGMVFILVAVIPELPERPIVSRRAGAALAAIVLAATVFSFDAIREYVDYRHEADLQERTLASAQTIAERPGDPMVAGYRDLDYPLLGPTEIAELPDDKRSLADQRLIEVEGIELTQPSPAEIAAARPATISRLRAATRSRTTAGGPTCTRLTPRGPDSAGFVRIRPGHGLLVARWGRSAQPPTFTVRRFAGIFSALPPAAQIFPLGRRSSGLLRFPADSSHRPWMAEIRLHGPTGLCVT